jgi:glutamate/tyrosine decarboxylase-like PLP-dependent enzyme
MLHSSANKNRNFRGSFIDPRGNNRSKVGDLYRTVLGMVLDHLCSASQKPVSPKVETYSDFAIIPDEALAIPELLDRVSFLIRQPRNLAHPGYIGNMEPAPTSMAVISGLIMAATKNNMLAEEMSPFLSSVEPDVVEWFAGQFGLRKEAGGGFLAGGTLGNLQALKTARNAKLGNHQQGIWDRKRAPVLFASEVAHSSLQKAAMVMGLGTSAVIAVRADENSRMDVDDLRKKVRASFDGGKQEPFSIVATAGTTITGNIDPLIDIASVAKEYGLWLHTDAAYGGALVFSPQYSNRLRGIDSSDSLTLNLHKWFYSSFSSSLLLFKDVRNLEHHFRIRAPYMASGQRAGNLGEYSVQGSRQADIIGLLFSLQHMGRRGFAELVEDRMNLARALRSMLDDSGLARFSGEMDTNILCFRPKAESAIQDVRELQQFLADEAEVCVTNPVYRGEMWLKAAVLNPYIVDSELRRLVDAFAGYCRRNLVASL